MHLKLLTPTPASSTMLEITHCFPWAVHTMAELKLTGNCLKGSRPLLSFDPTFDETPHHKLLKEMFTQVKICLYRVAHKNRTAYIHHNVDAITGISVWGNFTWEKLYQEQQFCFSSLFSRAHFVRQCRGPKFSLFSLTYTSEWMPFHLATVVNSNLFNLVNAHC